MSNAPFPETVRVDALEKVRGQTLYGADHVPEGLLHAALAVSAITRGTLRSLDVAAAEAVPGVVFVLTHENAGELNSPGFLLGGGLSFQSFQPMNGTAIVHRGQPIALVAAETLEAAEEAAHLVRATYDVEPLATTIDAEGSETLLQAEAELGHPSPDIRFGDAEGAFASAAFTVDAAFHSPAQHQNPIELISTLAEWDGDRLILHEGSQNANSIRFGVARQLGVSAETIEVRSPSCGGGFGQKNSLQTQTVLAAMAAYATRRPVKLVVSRAQIFEAASFRPECRHRIRLGADQSGRLIAALHEVDSQTSRHDLFPGEYCQTSARLHGIANFHGTHRMVRTDVQTPGYMRAPFEHTACLAMECAIDEIAYLSGRDPVELRLSNDTTMDPVEELPLSSRHLGECLRCGAEMFGWSARTMEPMSMRADDGSFVGWGVACGTYPGNAAANVARVTATVDGRVEVSAGIHEMGQGARTLLANVVSRSLGVPVDSVTAFIGDTRGVWPHLTAGSWGTTAAVPAVMRACDQLRDRLAALTPDAPETTGLFERLAASGERSMTVQVDSVAPGQDPASVDELASGFASPTGPAYPGFVTFSYVAHFVEVRVEPNTRRIRVPRVVSVADCGRVISPRTARSQIYGGVVWGIGATLREESETDPRFGGFLNADIAEYVIPVNADIGSIEAHFIDEPDPSLNAAGVKGLGEVVMAGVAPAIANAVFHATGRRIRDLPIRIDDLL